MTTESEIPEISSNATDCEAQRLWSYFDECGELPLGIAIVLWISGAWVLFLVVAAIRLTYLSRSSLANTTVSKKMQVFQAWSYSYFHSLVSLAALFSGASLIEEGQFITASFVFIFYLVATTLASQVDVIGTVGKKQGANDMDLLVMLEYFFHTYLLKAVWKMTGHREHGKGAKDEVKLNALEKLCCMGEVYNSYTPRVYDFKDVVGIQGAYLSLPFLFSLLLSIVHSNGVASYEEIKKLVSADGVTSLETIINEFDEFYFNPLIYVGASVAFLSAIATPLLGDWETFHKNIMMCIGSLVFRCIEIIARFGFYVYFVDFSRFSAIAMLAGEFFFMWLTCVNVAGISSNGRTSSASHKLLASWEAVFFTNYRRVHVDKDFQEKNLTLMPTTIELIRFVERTVATIIGYVVMTAKDIPRNYTEAVDNMRSLPILFFAGIAANVIVVLFNLINFFIVNRKQLSGSDVGKLKAYWKTLPVIGILLTPKTVHVNRDNDNFHAGGEPIHYI